MAKKIGLGFLGLIIILLVCLFLFQAQIGNAVFKRAVEQTVGRDSLIGLKDGLHVGLCGTGSPMPNLDRAGPCNVVIAGDQIFVVDIGEGGGRNISLMGIDAAQIDALLLTHFHSDHVDGLGPLQLFHWTRGASTAPLPAYGPTGVEKVIEGFNMAYATDDSYRTAHHGEAFAPSSGGGSVAHPFAMVADSVVVLKRGDLTITAFKVEHDPIDPAVGYRFDYKGRSACFSGDTDKSTNLMRACKGVDLLVHEALQPKMVKQIEASLKARGNTQAAKIMFDIQDYHTSPEDAAISAQNAGAEMLVLSHLVPALPSSYLYPAFLGDAPDKFDGPIVIGEDGLLFSMPAGNDKIEQSKLM